MIGHEREPLNQRLRGNINMKTEKQAVDIDRNMGDFSYPEAHMRDAGIGLERANDPLHLGC